MALDSSPMDLADEAATTADDAGTRRFAIVLALILVVLLGLMQLADPIGHVLADVLPFAPGGCGGG